MSWLEPLIGGSVPAGFAEWARSRPSLKDAWKSCDRADWLFWVAAARALVVEQLARKPEDPFALEKLRAMDARCRHVVS